MRPPKIEIPAVYDDPGVLVNETARLVYQWGVEYCGLTAEDLIYNWGRETQQLLSEERLNIEAELDDLLSRKAPIDQVRDCLSRWAENICELYQRHYDYRRQQASSTRRSAA